VLCYGRPIPWIFGRMTVQLQERLRKADYEHLCAESVSALDGFWVEAAHLLRLYMSHGDGTMHG